LLLRTTVPTVAVVEGGFRWEAAVLAFLGALWIQIGTNFANDVFDFEAGTDDEERLGPTRAVQSGLLTNTQVRRGMWVAFGLASLSGLGLFPLSGWPLLVIGVLSIAFRSLLVGLLSILPNAFPLVVAAAVLQVLDLELQMVSALAFSVCLGIAVDDTIHFLTRFKRELREGAGSVREAAVNAIIGVGRALLVTTAVLLGGFGVMLLSDIPTTQLFAKICCLGLLSALIGDLLFLPALLVVFFRAPNRHSPASSAELQAPLPDSP